MFWYAKHKTHLAKPELTELILNEASAPYLLCPSLYLHLPRPS